MAIFKFLGDPNAFGKPITKLIVHPKNGTRVTFLPPDSVSWKVGDNLPNITDTRCIRHLTADTRFDLV